MFSVKGNSVIAKIDLSGNETKVQVIVVCDRDYIKGEKVCINTVATDHSFIYSDELENAEAQNGVIQSEKAAAANIAE